MRKGHVQRQLVCFKLSPELARKAKKFYVLKCRHERWVNQCIFGVGEGNREQAAICPWSARVSQTDRGKTKSAGERSDDFHSRVLSDFSRGVQEQIGISHDIFFFAELGEWPSSARQNFFLTMLVTGRWRCGLRWHVCKSTWWFGARRRRRQGAVEGNVSGSHVGAGAV